jgi:pectate lyase
MKKKILLGLLILVALAAGTGFYLYNKPAEKTVSDDAAYTVEAPALFSEYESNEMQANTKYLNKVVEVKGKIASVSPKDAQGVTIALDANNEMFGVSCQVSETEGLATLKEGDMVTVKGLCTGLLMDVVLVKCSVEKN